MLSWLVAELWGSETRRRARQRAAARPNCPGFIAERSRRVVGLLTYQVQGDVLEIVTLNAIERRGGHRDHAHRGPRRARARHFRCREVRLTTTNDTTSTRSGFYQRRGFPAGPN